METTPYLPLHTHIIKVLEVTMRDGNLSSVFVVSNFKYSVLEVTMRDGN